MKLKRMIAFIIDWNLSAVPILLFVFFFRDILISQEPNPLLVIIFVLLTLSMPTICVLRDVIFNGQSIGKRIFKLHIIDETNKLPSKRILIIRNIFFFVYPVDAILLLATNQSIGDMATRTTVVNK